MGESRARIEQLYNKTTHKKVINKNDMQIKNHFLSFLKLKTKYIFQNKMSSHRFPWLLISFLKYYFKLSR